MDLFFFAIFQPGEHDPQSGGRGGPEFLFHELHALLHLRIRAQVFCQVIVDIDHSGQRQGYRGQHQEKTQKDFSFICKE